MIVKKKINIQRINASKFENTDFNNLQFGRVFSDHMLEANFIDGKWKSPLIKPFQNFQMSPGCPALHYGQTCFEGMKAFRQENNQVVLFRPYDNFQRLNRSAKRLCMEPVIKDVFIDGLKQLVTLDEKWVLKGKDRSLYLRPFLFASGEFIVARPSKEYMFFIITSPSQAYYREEIKVIIEEQFTRAAKGGIGFAKAGGNYGASFYPTQLAVNKGYTQLIWTDAKQHEFIEESSTMNLMFRKKDTLITPKLGDSILPGITRSSVIQLANDLGIEVKEAKISVKEIIDDLQSGELIEAFGVGTAVTISSISTISFRDVDYKIQTPNNSFARLLKKKLQDIQYGRAEDKHKWTIPLI